MSAGAGPAGETNLDQVMAFTVAGRDIRGRMVRLGPVLDTILGAHDYPPALRHLLAEALVLAALMGSLLKSHDSQLTFQAQAQGGPVDLLVCDYRAGELRGYVRHDPAALAALGNNPGLQALFGEGYLAVTFDIGESGQRYQGIVPLAGASLAEACESYFRQSEQIPTLIRVAVKSGPEGTLAAGLLAQHLPEGEEGRERLHVRHDHPDWEHVAALAGSIRHDELLATVLTLEDLAWRLFHDEREIRVMSGPALTRGCRCSAEYYRSVLEKFPEAERDHMRNDAGVIAVDCAFCSRVFDIAL
jgi:molecular chaperone Hsp33